jgi:TusA-related sulfurtransferase
MLPDNESFKEPFNSEALANTANDTPLDLRKTKCPLNFVKARLALEKLGSGEVLELWILPDSPSAINLPQSLQQEGHVIVDDQTSPEGTRQLKVKRR